MLPQDFKVKDIMAQSDINPKISRADTGTVTDCPDTLQDLCIFYLMNNLDILVPSLNKIQDKNEEFSLSFSSSHANKMLGYYSKCCLPCDNESTYIDQLMAKYHRCDEIRVTSTSSLASTNVQSLADTCKSVRRLDLTCFDHPAQLKAYRTLLENNLPHLTKVKLSQKCEEEYLIGYLNLLGGRDFDADVEMPESGDDDEQATRSNTKLIEDETVEKTGLQCRIVDTKTVTDVKTIETEEKKSEDISNKNGLDLKSFTYLQIDSSAHPNLAPCRSFGWFYALLSRVVSSNQHLQSFKFVTILSNPIEWFLSQPDLPKLKDLQSLCLSFEYFEDYAADSEEIKMPYTDKFFTNLPLLQNLRHLDISRSVEMEEYMVSLFYYSQEKVEMFIEAVKMMPQLKSLDVSGTNLASVICHTDDRDTECREHCMPGFEGRRFDFLGLFATDACRHKFIPADRVSGNASIEQLKEALMSLQHNLKLMLIIVHDIRIQIMRKVVGTTTALALIDGLMMFIERLGEWNGSGCAEEFGEESVGLAMEVILLLVEDHGVEGCFTVKRKRLLLEQLLSVCHVVSTLDGWNEKNRDYRNMILEDSMLLMFHLQLKPTVINSYRFKHYIQVLLEIFNSPARESETTHALGHIRSICKDNQQYKAYAGTELKLVEELLKEIESRKNKYADVSPTSEEFMWRILWTLTDGVPCNCEAFVQNEGLHISKFYIDKCPNEIHVPLFIGVTGTLVNVSENPCYSTLLMTSDMVSMFRRLLSYESEKDFYLSFEVAGFLIMLASKGPEAWTVVEPSRNEILEEIDKIMHKWNITDENVYRIDEFSSLIRFLSQLDNYSTPVAQYWASWHIFNLVTVKSEKYCPMLVSEGGLSKIDSVLHHGGLREDIVTLLEKIKAQTMVYKEQSLSSIRDSSKERVEPLNLFCLLSHAHAYT